MAKFKKGQPRHARAGRKAGTPNKINHDLKEAIGNIVISNIENFQSWFIDIAQNDPAKAANLYLKLCEFFLPKADKKDVEIKYAHQPIKISILPVATKKDAE